MRFAIRPASRYRVAAIVQCAVRISTGSHRRMCMRQQRVLRVVVMVMVTALLAAGCSGVSWNPVRWFKKAPPPPPAVVAVLKIEPGSENAADRFAQSWDGARLIVDIESPS